MRNVTLLTKALFAKHGQTPETVALPHTWNAFDGQDGGADYWRGIGIYDIELPNPTKGKIGALLGNQETAAILGGLFQQMMGGSNLMGSMGEMSPEMMAFMNNMRLSDALKMFGDKFPMAAKLQLNQALNAVKK